MSGTSYIYTLLPLRTNTLQTAITGQVHYEGRRDIDFFTLLEQVCPRTQSQITESRLLYLLIIIIHEHHQFIPVDFLSRQRNNLGIPETDSA